MTIESLVSRPELPGSRSAGDRLVAWLAGTWRSAVPEALRSARTHTLFTGLIALYVAAELYLPALMGVETPFTPAFGYRFFLMMSALTLAFPACFYGIYVMICIRPKALTLYLAQAAGRFLSARRVFMALPVILLFPFFGSAFAYFRILLPNIQPWHWDLRLAEIDRALHGGMNPWEILHPLLGNPFITAAINGVYHLWFLLMFGTFLWQSGSLTRPHTRMQFFLTFILIWAILGNFLAILLSSAGPVYYARVTGLASPFEPLMDYLHAADKIVPVMALDVQEQLWSSYVQNGLATLGGITAMPSMHVATSLSFALVGYAHNRKLGHLLLLFTFIVQIGSVHLGWHYAIDGYVAAIGTLLVWWCVGHFLRLGWVRWLLWGSDTPWRVDTAPATA
jgi:PAP2 superfamily